MSPEMQIFLKKICRMDANEDFGPIVNDVSKEEEPRLATRCTIIAHDGIVRLRERSQFWKDAGGVKRWGTATTREHLLRAPRKFKPAD